VSLTVVAMADTHGHHSKLVVPDGDILIHAGDLTERGTRPQLEDAREWLRSLPHAHKVLVAGNHDFLFETEPAAARALFEDFIYLEDHEATVAGLRIWGSPWQPWFYSWAFNLHRGATIDEKWRLIPEGLDILVTHGPPAGYGDRCSDGRLVGCEDLLRHVGRTKPRFHLFGHIHEARGQWEVGGTRLCNVTTDECAQPVTVLTV
jgi:Icc-related predicted phosphoesterase